MINDTTVITTLILIVVFCPTALSLQMYKTYQLRHHPCLRARSMKSTYIASGLGIIFLLVFIPFQLIASIQPQMLQIACPLYLLLMHTQNMLWTVAMWNITYHLKWNALSSQMKWIQHISSKYVENHYKTQWFLNLDIRKRYGNEIWVLFHRGLPPLVIPLLIQLIICELGRSGPSDADGTAKLQQYDLIFELNDLGLHILQHLVKTVILYEWTKIQFNDYYQVRVDYCYGYISSTFSILVYAAMISIKNLGYMTYYTYAFLTGALSGIAVTVGLIFLLWYPLYVFKIDSSFSSKSKMLREISNSNSIATHASIQAILKDRLAIDAFMQHLFREFSSENMLCIIEMCQLITWYNSSNLNVKDDPDFKSVAELDPEVPISDIVEDDKLSFEEKAHKLVDKYISTTAELEVNIGYELRQQTLSYKDVPLKNQTAQQWIQLFNAVISSLTVLLGDALSRFDNPVIMERAMKKP